MATSDPILAVDTLAGRGRSPLLLDHDYGLGISGLRRIRQNPTASRGPSRGPTAPSSPSRTFTLPPRAASMHFEASPSSPGLSFQTDDLTRFPSESLHSFSFSPQVEDAFTTRQTMLKKAVEYMRDRLGWGASQAEVMSARAKLSADAEVQTMIDLLIRGNAEDGKSTRRLSSPKIPPRVTLRRSQTDISLRDVQSRLVEALGQEPESPRVPYSTPTPLLHSHSNRPSTQAIFTTETTSPWMILAANDMACLVLGVSMAEIRTLNMLEFIAQERRTWLEDRLKIVEEPVRSTSAMGSGLTASLLNKPSWRSQNCRKSDHHGVRLCGDVLSIHKHDGNDAWASFWVKEKRGGLIWVLEEVEQDQAFLRLDEDANIMSISGAFFRAQPGHSILAILPRLPMIDGFAVDKKALEMTSDSKFLTIHENEIFPVMIEMRPAARELVVRSFPNLAGIVVVTAADLIVINANAVFTSNLFGRERPAGSHIRTLIPAFEKILDRLAEDDEILLEDGATISEQTFVRAQEDEPLVGLHRDGSDLKISIQMRVVQKSDTVYALWISYARPTISEDVPSIVAKLEEAALAPLASNLTRKSNQNLRYDHTRNSSWSSLKKSQKQITDYTILEDMGEGAYGQVKLALDSKDTGAKVVIKYVLKRRILVDTWTRDRRLGTVPLEIHVLDYLRRDDLDHPNIVEMTDFFEDDVNYYIEMVPHGLPGMDLFDYIEMRSTMDEAECRSIFRQVVSAVHHLHTKALVVHRDIKDENIILDGTGKVKLIDFGSAAYIKNGPFDVFVGTIDYAAPEVLQGKSYGGKQQDIWALGILLYTLVYKENPFYSVDEILDHELRIPFVMSDSNIDIIQAMLNRDVSNRLDIEQVSRHSWCMET